MDERLYTLNVIINMIENWIHILKILRIKCTKG
jgi:hypothetical protein